MRNKTIKIVEVDLSADFDTKTPYGKSFPKNVAELAESNILPILPPSYIDIPKGIAYPQASCARVFSKPFLISYFKEKRLRQTLRYIYICSWQNWQNHSHERLQTAWNFLKSETAKYPGYAKRHCRKEALEIIKNGIREHIEKPGNTIPGLAPVLDKLRQKYKQEWKEGRWLILPARLLRRDGESFQQWDDRCFAAAGFRKWQGRAA